jgi:hypothetical protein
MSDIAAEQSAATGAGFEAVGAPKSASDLSSVYKTRADAYRAGVLAGLYQARTIIAAGRCSNDLGSDPEIGHLGCTLDLQDFECVCRKNTAAIDAEINAHDESGSRAALTQALAAVAPPSAPIVTDASIDAALDAWFPGENWRTYADLVDDWRRDMRAALTAALSVNGGGA